MKITDAEVVKKYANLVQSAEARKIPFSLTFATVRRLLSVKRCYFTNQLFSSKIGSPTERTIDRLDNGKGYIENNVVACIKDINLKKGSMSLEDIKNIYNGVKKLL